jgi:phage tail sheath gpL-like
MPIDFSYVPPNTLLPLFYAEVTSAQAPINPNLKLCIVGHKARTTVVADDGTAVENTLYNVTRDEDALNLFGKGSQLYSMYLTARANAPFSEIWCIACPESVTGVKAVGSITVSHAGTSVHAGVLGFYIAGRLIQVKVLDGSTKEQIAKAIQRAINDHMDVPVKASGATGATGEFTVTLTCRWAGVTGNEIRISYVGRRGRADAMGPSAQLARYLLTVVQMTSGDGETETGGTFAAIGDRPFDLFVFPFTSQNLLDDCMKFMNGEAGRWSPAQQLYGHFVTARIAAFQPLYDLGAARNDPHMTILGIMQSIVPSWEWSSALAGVMVTHWSAPPELSRPLQTLELVGVAVGSDDDESFIPVERQQLLEQGLSTFHVEADTTCRIDRVRTTRKSNLYGDPDPSWADAITMFQAMYFVRQMRAEITGAFPRAALSDEPTGINGFTSPPEIEMIILNTYDRFVTDGLCENPDLFSQLLVVERDSVDANRVNALMKPDFVNQLRVVAALVETHLELVQESPGLAA